MKKWLMLSLLLALWGGYRFPGVTDDLLTKKISRPEQIVELSVFLFILMILVVNFLRRANLHRSFFPKPLGHRFSIYVFVFYLMALSSSIVSYYPYYSFFRAGQYLIVIFLVAYLLDELPDRGVIVKILFFFCLANLIYVAAGLAFFPHIVEASNGSRLAGGGIFKGDGGAAPFAVSILSLCYYFTTQKKAYKMASAILFIIALVFLLLYQNRNIMYQAPFYYLFIIYFYRGLSIKAFISISMILVVLTTMMLVGFPLYERFAQRGINSESRIRTWEIVMKKRDQIPLLGFGFLGTPAYLLSVKKSVDRKGIGGITADPHNYFLTALTEFGVFGLLYAVMFFVLILWLVLKRFKQRVVIPQDVLLPGLIAIILQNTVSGFVTNFLIASISLSTISTITCLMLLDSSVPLAVRSSDRLKNIRARSKAVSSL